MAEYYLTDPQWTVHLPDAMAFATAAPLMPGSQKGAKAMGYRVVAVDTRAPPIELISSLPDRFKADLIP